MAYKQRSDAIDDAKVLIVGAGGIGCELIKTVALTGFHVVHIIDKDTVQPSSNLNRAHAWFRNSHVGKSKARVAKDAVLRFRPRVCITSYHANVKDSRFNKDFFEKFQIVLSGLGNFDARRHVNRLCLTANIPLVETRIAGFIRQVTVHINGRTECVECQPNPSPETYTVCSITDTPSKFVHCIVWAKEFLFGKLFGDRSQEIDLNVRSSESGSSEPNEDVFIRRKDESIEEYGRRIYDYVFGYNIEIALSNEETWKNRNRPKPIYIRDLLNETADENCAVKNVSSLSAMTPLGLENSQEILSLIENTSIFFETLELLLLQRQKEIGSLSFDIDDHLAMEFVTAAANIRAASFGIPLHSLFEAKGVASNIVHDVSATNAVIAGLIVIEAVKVLQEQADNYKNTYLLESPTKNMLLVPIQTFVPNEACYVCSEAVLYLEINTHRSKLRDFVDKIVKAKLGINLPLIKHKSTFIYEVGDDLEEAEIANFESNLEKVLSQLPCPVTRGALLYAGDLIQLRIISIKIIHREEFDEVKEPDGMLLIGWTHDDKPPTTDNTICASTTSSPMLLDTEDHEIDIFTTDPNTSHTSTKRKLSDISTNTAEEIYDDSDFV